MSGKRVYLDFLNREAERAGGRVRSENTDIQILQVILICAPYGLSANISQITEYCSEKPHLFNYTKELIGYSIIDATSQAGSINEFITSRQILYSHTPKRYPFFFEKVDQFQYFKLGTRNTFDMTAELSQKLLNYKPEHFEFELYRANPNDRRLFEENIDGIQNKIFHRENLAVTRELLESNRGSINLNIRQISAASRIVSALYMKIYSDKHSLATCTGIQNFPYRELEDNFPQLDIPILAVLLDCLGARRLIDTSNPQIISSFYGNNNHRMFAYYVKAFLAASMASVRMEISYGDRIGSLRASLQEFITREIGLLDFKDCNSWNYFLEVSVDRLRNIGEGISNNDPYFSEKWRIYVPEQTKELVVITTATDAEDKALFKTLEIFGFTKGKIIIIDNNICQEYNRSITEKIIHIRTNAGSLGVNSAGGVLSASLKALKPKFVLSVGICFGLKSQKHHGEGQELGDVIFSTHIQDYETVREGTKNKIRNRGERLPAAQTLLQATRIARNSIANEEYKCIEGLILSGQKLVDNKKLVEKLRANFPDAVGGRAVQR